MKTKFILIFTAMLAMGLFVLVSCEGPMGPQGPPGEQGPPGPVGPAGSDGSIIHAGQGAPEGNTGKPGDFFLDLTAGNLFGPKMAEGWGAPFNLVGEDGQDGSHIYAGNGAPDSSSGKEGDYYLDKTSYDLYGPKTGSGWGTPIHLQGPQGEQGPQGLSAFLDIQYVEATTRVTTDDETSIVSLVVNCPAGYNVLGGGAGPSFSTAVNIARWFMTSSSPRLAEDSPLNDFDSWRAVFKTVDGEDAEGTYGFFVEAICAKI